MTRERLAYGLLALVLVGVVGWGAGWLGGRMAADTTGSSDAQVLWCANNGTAVMTAAETLFPDLAAGQSAEDFKSEHPQEWARACAAGYEVLVQYGWQTPAEG